MTWSFNAPRAVTRGPGAAETPATTWSPDDLSSGRPRPMNRPSGATPDHASAELAEVRDEAFARGYAAGVEAGEAAEGERLRSAAIALYEALVSVQDNMQQWTGNAQENVCALATAIARHVVGLEVTVNPLAVQQVARAALAEFPIEQPIIVHLSPADHAAVCAALSDDEAMTRAESQWIADPMVAPGGCLIEGRDRIIDGRVDTALERLYRRLSATGA